MDEYFRGRGLRKTGNRQMFLKTAAILLLLPVSYLSLLFADSLIVALIAGFALAQAFILLGLNVMHDGNHGSYSSSSRVNRLMGWGLELGGGSSLVWRQKHNILHHTYTNIHEWDDDLNTSGLLRLSPNQVRHWWQRFQHLYAFLAYAFLTFTWVTTSDLSRLLRDRIATSRMPRTSSSSWAFLILSKAAYFGYMIALPLYFHPALHVLIAFVGIHMIQGVTLSVVFQLAHAMDENSFPNSDQIHNEWAAHEVETTANFATTNKMATWYLGGLNHQIEHHLFPKICHVHYPAISQIVKKTCEEFSIAYVTYPTVRSAIFAHYRFLQALGQKP